MEYLPTADSSLFQDNVDIINNCFQNFDNCIIEDNIPKSYRYIYNSKDLLTVSTVSNNKITVESTLGITIETSNIIRLYNDNIYYSVTTVNDNLITVNTNVQNTTSTGIYIYDKYSDNFELLQKDKHYIFENNIDKNNLICYNDFMTETKEKYEMPCDGEILIEVHNIGDIYLNDEKIINRSDFTIQKVITIHKGDIITFNSYYNNFNEPNKEDYRNSTIVYSSKYYIYISNQNNPFGMLSKMG